MFEAIVVVVLMVAGMASFALDHQGKVFRYGWGQWIGAGLISLAVIVAVVLGVDTQLGPTDPAP